jgi:hypothetical protein
VQVLLRDVDLVAKDDFQCRGHIPDDRSLSTT